MTVRSVLHSFKKTINILSRLASRLEAGFKENPSVTQTKMAELSDPTDWVLDQLISRKIKSLRLEYAEAMEIALGYSHIWLVIDEGGKGLS